MAKQNKKILFFVDESGTAGSDRFALGCVMIRARDCGKADKAFSDLLPSSINEVHAIRWKPANLQSLLEKLSKTAAAAGLLMFNKRPNVPPGTPPVVYAQTLISTVKTGIKRFANAQGKQRIGNVEVIVDANSHNVHPEFVYEIESARLTDGRFKAVTRVVPIDSAASRLLQLADIVAHSRTWIDREGLSAQRIARRMENAYKISVL